MNEIIEKEEIKVENMIYEIRGKQVILDNDVAMLFGYETKYLNRQVQRNINRFPENYCFQLNEEEYNSLRCQIGTLKQGKGQHKKYLPYVFTEYGITMLAGILKSDTAVEMSLKIVNTFIAMRKYINSNLIEQTYICLKKLLLSQYSDERSFIMAKYKVDISGINTSSLKPLTNEQNLELFKKMQEGDLFARDDLINGNLKLVLSILKKFNNKVDNLDDLFQVGCLGLVKAIDNFDTSYNVTLSTYACPITLGWSKICRNLL